MDGGAGICKYLNQESNLCEIYNTRPVFCNVDAMYDLLFKDKSSMTREEFYELNYKACEEIYNLYGGSKNSTSKIFLHK